MMIRSSLVALGLLLAPATAHAGLIPEIGVTGGTLGVGPQVSFSVLPLVALRGNATFLKVNKSVSSDGVDYDGNLKLGSFGGTVDVYPTGGGFRLSAGARANQNKVGLHATPSGSVEIGGETYTAAEVGTIDGEVKAKNKIAPYATIGYNGSIGGAFHIGFDVGAMLQGSPEVTRLDTTGLLKSNATFQASIADERAQIESDISKFKLYPVVQISLGVGF